MFDSNLPQRDIKDILQEFEEKWAALTPVEQAAQIEENRLAQEAYEKRLRKQAVLMRGWVWVWVWLRHWDFQIGSIRTSRE